MTFVVVEPSGSLRKVDFVPDRPTLFTILGGAPEYLPTGYDVFGVCCCEAVLLGWERNPVAGAMLAILGAPWQVYAGPVAFLLGTPDEPAGLTVDNLEAALRCHQDVCWVLDMDGVTEPASAVSSVPSPEIRRAADYILSQPV